MTLHDWIRARQTIRRVAAQECRTVAAVRASMQEAIDEAWENKTASSAAAWLSYFPDGKKPTLEEFIMRLGQELKSMPGEQN